MGKTTIFNKVLTEIANALDVTPAEIGLTSEYRTRSAPKADQFKKCYKECIRVFPRYIIDVDNATLLCIKLFDLIEKERHFYHLDSLSNDTDHPYSGYLIDVEQYNFLAIKSDIEKLKENATIDKKNIVLILAELLRASYTIAFMTKRISSKSFEACNKNTNTSNENLSNSSKESAFTDENKLRDGLILGYKIARFLWFNGNHEQLENEIKLLSELVSQDCKISIESYTDLQQSILSFYKQKDIVYFSAICIGIYLERISLPDDLFDSVSEKVDRNIYDFFQASINNGLQAIDDIPNSIFPEKNSFLEYIIGKKHYPISTQIEYVVRFFIKKHDISNSVKDAQMRKVIEVLYQDKVSYENAKKQLLFSIYQANLLTSNEITDCLETLLYILDHMSEDEYNTRMKYNVWGVTSLWRSQDFSNLCESVIGETIKKSQNRAEAIELSENALKICKIFDREKDIQILSWVLLEFQKSTDDEFFILQNYMLNN